MFTLSPAVGSCMRLVDWLPLFQWWPTGSGYHVWADNYAQLSVVDAATLATVQWVKQLRMR